MRLLCMHLHLMNCIQLHSLSFISLEIQFPSCRFIRQSSNFHIKLHITHCQASCSGRVVSVLNPLPGVSIQLQTVARSHVLQMTIASSRHMTQKFKKKTWNSKTEYIWFNPGSVSENYTLWKVSLNYFKKQDGWSRMCDFRDRHTINSK